MANRANCCHCDQHGTRARPLIRCHGVACLVTVVDTIKEFNSAGGRLGLGAGQSEKEVLRYLCGPGLSELQRCPHAVDGARYYPADCAGYDSQAGLLRNLKIFKSLDNDPTKQPVVLVEWSLEQLENKLCNSCRRAHRGLPEDHQFNYEAEVPGTSLVN